MTGDDQEMRRPILDGAQFVAFFGVLVQRVDRLRSSDTVLCRKQCSFQIIKLLRHDYYTSVFLSFRLPI